LLVVPSLNLAFAHLTYGEGPNVADDAGHRVADAVPRARRGDPKADARTTDVVPQPFTTAQKMEWLERVAVPTTTTTKYLSEPPGRYEVTPTVRAEIFEHDGALCIDMPGCGEAELFHPTPDTLS
jgi:hypothetical protein